MAPEPTSALRHDAERAQAGLPEMLVEAGDLARAFGLGGHGQRRAGAGHDFWQYRPFVQGDSAGAIDWRRSALSDGVFIREVEGLAARDLMIWVDTSAHISPPKLHRARVLALALAMVVLRAGDRVGIAGHVPAKGGNAHLDALAHGLMAPATRVPSGAGAHLVMMSDFLQPDGDFVQNIADMGPIAARLSLVQVLSEDELTFPFRGATRFEITKDSALNSPDAAALRAPYLAALATRQERLARIGARGGFHCHGLGEPAHKALLWLYSSLKRGQHQ